MPVSHKFLRGVVFISSAITGAWYSTAANAAQPSLTGYSGNWSGYAATASGGDTFTNVSGNWIVPTVKYNTASSSGAAQYSCYWVGFDGAFNGTVEQAGIEADVAQNGTTQYYAWYEFYPISQVRIYGFAVNPGDSMFGEVKYIGSDQYTITLKNLTENQSFIQTFTSTGNSRTSAEWIAEATSVNGNVSQLPDFGTVSFTNSLATDTALGLGAVNSFSNYQVFMNQSGYGFNDYANPSALNISGTDFTVSFVPEPAIASLTGVGGLLILRRQRKAK